MSGSLPLLLPDGQAGKREWLEDYSRVCSTARRATASEASSVRDREERMGASVTGRSSLDTTAH